jgi:hypothetical protein
MKNLFDQLCRSGLTEAQANKALEVLSVWLEENYPVLGTLAKNALSNNEAFVKEEK